MRTHGEHALLGLWADPVRTHALVRADALAAIRFELVERAGTALGWIDLTFVADGEIHVVPGLLTDLADAVLGDAGALVWPRYASAAAAAVPEIAERVSAHLAGLLGARAVPAEDARLLGAPSPAFDAARKRGDVGAAPLRVVLTRMAPWVHTARVAGGEAARISAKNGALGAAVLRTFGIASEFRPGDDARAWYAVTSSALRCAPGIVVDDDGTSLADEAYHVALGRPRGEGWREIAIAAPRPLDRTLSDDGGDDAGNGSFWVREAVRHDVPPATPAQPALPAAGRVAILARADLHTQADVDTDHIDALADGLRAAGATVHVSAYLDRNAIPPVDCTVAFGDLADPAYREALQRPRPHPLVAVPEPLAPYAAWFEAAAIELLAAFGDDEQLELRTLAFDAGELPVTGVERTGRGSRDGGREITVALRGASAIVVGPGDEGAVLTRAAGGDALPIVPVLPLIAASAAPARGLAGRRPFAFAHAPAIPRSGLLALAFALRDVDLPLIVATSGGDARYLTLLRHAAGPYTSIIVDPPADRLAALYAQAALFVDVALRPRGSGRLLRAIRAGALPLVVAGSPSASFVGPGELIPRATLESIRDALLRRHRSPLRAARAAALQQAAEAMFDGTDPLRAFRGTLARFVPGLAPA